MSTAPAYYNQKADPVEQFKDDVKRAGCMGTKRDAVMFLARKIGRTEANKVAFAHGLKDSFYTAYMS